MRRGNRLTKSAGYSGRRIHRIVPGVAGVDRLVMLALGAESTADVIAFGRSGVNPKFTFFREIKWRNKRHFVAYFRNYPLFAAT